MDWCARLPSVESLAGGVEAAGPDRALLVHSVHWLVARVARKLHLVVLNHVLLDDGLAGVEVGRLLDSGWVEVGLGDESVIAWDVRRGLGGSHGELVVLVALHGGVCRQFVARVVAVRPNRLLKLGLEVAALGGVGLARVAPDRSL